MSWAESRDNYYDDDNSDGKVNQLDDNGDLSDSIILLNNKYDSLGFSISRYY